MTMTADTTPGAAGRADTAGRARFAGTATLTRFALRRDRVKFPAWVGGLGLFTLYVVVAVPAAYPQEELAGTTALFSDPVGRMLTGPGFGFDDPDHAQFVANGYGLYLMLLAALMSILAVVRHTRAEEQTGRAELVRANAVGSHAILTAALVMAVLTNAAGAAVVFVAMTVVGGFGAVGSAVLAAATAATGLAFAGVAAVTAQLSEYSRAAAGIAGAALGASFVLRAGGDMVRTGGSPMSWASPLGWAQQSAPFVLDRWWPLALLVALAAGSTALGFVLSTRRDLGASFLAVRPGPARGGRLLASATGLAMRLGRAAVIGWSASLAVTGLAFGAFVQPLIDAADDLPAVLAEVLDSDDVVAGYVAYLGSTMAVLVAVYAVMAVQSLRSEEEQGRLEPVLATPLARTRWLLANLAVVVAGTVVITVLTGAATGLGAALVTGDVDHLATLTGAHLNQLPAVWAVLGAATLLYGTRPRWLPAVWALLGYGFVVGTFGTLLDLPQALFDVSPFEHPAAMPLDAFSPVPLAWLTVVAVALGAVGVAGFARRDVGAA